MSHLARLRETAAAVREGRISAVALARQALGAIRAHDPAINAVTRILEDRALADAAKVDALVAAGQDPGPLAGVPFGVKDLFDVAGLPNTAGSRLRENDPPASADAEAVCRLCAAGALLVATLNMDEFAYGFATVNAFHGTTRNPRDTARLAGGSSGGSAAAVAGGMLPLTLGSDTNGSVRIPAALCGVFGLKPTHGGLPMAGVAPFVDSFDDVGPFTNSLDDMMLAYQVLLDAPAKPVAVGTIRVGKLGGWFAANLSDAMEAAIGQVAAALDAVDVELPDVAAARSSAYLMTAAEGGALHLPDLRRRPLDFDPATRDRLFAGALLPAYAYADAERFRAWFRARALELFQSVDILLAPVTGDVAPPIDAPTISVDGKQMPARSHLGLYTQPISFIGLPVLAVPLARAGQLPLGLQLIGAPGTEALLFALARRMADLGLIAEGAPC